MKKLVFISPKWKWGTYYYYKDITDYLIENYKNQYDVIFCNSLKDYILRHFKKADIIFSIVPFLFKPLLSKKYIFNLHWNFKEERKSKNLWAKLQYLAELNLWFSDKILLTSYFLADKLWFRKKYENKILISPLFLKTVGSKIKRKVHTPLRLLTVSSANFLEKWMWVYDLAKQIFKIKDFDINRTIILPWNIDNKNIILNKIQGLQKWKNIQYKILDFIQREELDNLYIENDIFVYATRLDTRWWVIMEACSFWLPIILLPYELWNYIWYPNNFIAQNIQKQIWTLLKIYVIESTNSIEFVKPYSIENTVWNNFIEIIRNC